MYIKLTRLDNTPIWINASFVVTVEPRKGGGSIVVPIGDGLDYDVKEPVESVLALLGDAPAPAVVPVPPPPGLAPKTLGVAPETAPTPAPATPAPTETADPKSAAPAPVKKTARSRAKAKAAEPEAAGADAAAGASPDATATDGAAAADGATTDAAPAKKPRATRKAKKPPLELSEDEVARLRKLAPGSVRKLQNTLVSQFRTVDTDATLEALAAHGILEIDRDHIIWK